MRLGRAIAVLVVWTSLGCGGLFGGEEPLEIPTDEEGDDEGDEDEDGVADGPTGDTGVEDTAPAEPPRKDRKGGKGRKGKGRKGGGDRDGEAPRRGDGQEQPKKPGGGGGGGGGGGAKSLCFSAKGDETLALRFDMKGDDIVGGSLRYKAAGTNVQVDQLTGKRQKGRAVASGDGKVNGGQGTVKVQAGKANDKVVVKVGNNIVKGAKISPCP